MPNQVKPEILHCNKCAADKPATEFYRGMKTQCKECKKNYEKQKRKSGRVSVTEVETLISRLADLELSMEQAQNKTKNTIAKLKADLAKTNRESAKMDKGAQR